VGCLRPIAGGDRGKNEQKKRRKNPPKKQQKTKIEKQVSPSEQPMLIKRGADKSEKKQRKRRKKRVELQGWYEVRRGTELS
jgi:hypothetical protein